MARAVQPKIVHLARGNRAGIPGKRAEARGLDRPAERQDEELNPELLLRRERTVAPHDHVDHGARLQHLGDGLEIPGQVRGDIADHFGAGRASPRAAASARSRPESKCARFHASISVACPPHRKGCASTTKRGSARRRARTRSRSVSCRTTRREIRHKPHNPVVMTANRSNKTIRLTSYAACAG